MNKIKIEEFYGKVKYSKNIFNLNNYKKIMNDFICLFKDYYNINVDLLEYNKNNVFYNKQKIFTLDYKKIKNCKDLNEFHLLVEEYFQTILNQVINIKFNLSEGKSELINIEQNIKNITGLSFNDVYREIKYTQQVEHILENINRYNNPILVRGDSSSGKTYSVVRALANLNFEEYSYTWIDFSDVYVNISNFIFSVLRFDKRKKHILVLDNLQVYPFKIKWIKEAIEFIKEINKNVDFQIILISWNFIKNAICDEFENEIIDLPFVGEESVKLLLDGENNKYSEDIISNSKGDIYIANKTLEYISLYKEFPTSRQLSEMIYNEFTKNLLGDRRKFRKHNEVLFYLACLGTLEIHVEKGYIINKGYQDELDYLIENKIIRAYMTGSHHTYLNIGHRSLAHKIMLHILNLYADMNEIVQQKGPVDLAIEYFQSVGNGSEQLFSTLQRLDLQSNNNIFSKLWDCFSVIRSKLLKPVENMDLTWGNNMASMIFAVEAYCEMKFDSSFDVDQYISKTLIEINKRWTYKSDFSDLEYIQNDASCTVELEDFTKKICETMKEEEKTKLYSDDMKHDKIDFEKMHKNWLVGLLIGCMGITKNNELMQKYIQCAENMISNNGAFYPERVSWVTTRCIIGLTHCGIFYNDIHNKYHQLIKKSCDWLVSQFSPHLPWEVEEIECGGWYSGTGTWNSNEQITIMSLYALRKAKFPMEKYPVLIEAEKEIINKKDLLVKMFKKNNVFLDSMWLVALMVENNKDISDVIGLIQDMTNQTLEKWSTASLSADDTNSESSDMQFLAKEIIKIIWTLLTRNIKQLLTGLEVDYNVSDNKREIFISYRRIGGASLSQIIYEGLDKKFKDNVFRDIEVLKTQCGKFNEMLDQAIENAKVFIAIVSKGCFERGYQTKDNSDDVFFQELKQAYELGKTIIPIYDHKVECPDELKSNPEFYEIAQKLAEEEAIVFDAKTGNNYVIESLIVKIMNKGIK